jgi:hypothetical protein
MQFYEVTVRFNSRLKGAGQSHTTRLDAANIQAAIDAAMSEAVRIPEHGQSIYVVGATVDEVVEVGP